MSMKTSCASCNFILHNSNLEPPSETIKKYNGVCPNCQKPLSPTPLEVLINGKPYVENKNKNAPKPAWRL